MSQPLWTKGNQQQTSSTGFFVWLGGNMIQVGILLVLIVGGVIAYLALNKGQLQKTRETKEKAEWTLKDWRESRSQSRSRYANADCGKDLHCRQLKRIYEDGGASPDAIRKNLLAADRNITFEQLQANANKYAGMAWAFEGKIHDIIGQETRGFGDYIVAEILIGNNTLKRVYVRGDFRTNFQENDYVYVVGYITGMTFPPLGPNYKNERGNTPSMTARAFLRPSEAREILFGSGSN